ncbi:MAG TPA: hypothetical protein PLK29_03815 [Chiayiivirga sp.]|nr:hypothetical protein [Chiayiivirga sp.]
MFRALFATCLFSCLALSVPLCRAEIMVGGMGAPEGSTHPLSQFTSLAQGTMTPYRQIAGPGIQIREPLFGTYEPNQQLIYISDFRGQAVRVFPAFASGDVAPIRVINPPRLGQTRANAPVFAHNELGVIAYNCCIDTYPLDASGDAVRSIREINWGGGGGGSGLNNPSHLFYLPASDEYAVLDSEPAPSYAARIVFHHRLSSGSVPPSRMITGPSVANARGVAYDPSTRRIFVLRITPQPPPAGNLGLINVFDDQASGDAAPLHSIHSADLHEEPGHYFVGLGFDSHTGRLMISRTQYGNPASNRILTFNAAAVGSTSPVQDLSGTNLSPYSVGIPFGVPLSPPGPMPLLAVAEPSAIAYGDTSALSSLGGQGVGAVSFSVTAGPGACEVSGNTLTAIGTGACTVTATKAQAFPYPEQSASVNLTITPAAQAPLTAFASPNTLPVGNTSALTTQGGSGTGAVSFLVTDGFGSCAIQGNTLDALAPGSCILRALKAGDDHYYIAASQEVTVTVVAGEGVFADGFENAPPGL